MTAIEVVRKLEGLTRDKLNYWEKESIIKPEKIPMGGKKRPRKDYSKEFERIELIYWFCKVKELSVKVIGDMATNILELRHAVCREKNIAKISIEIIMKDTPVTAFKVMFCLMTIGVNFIATESKTFTNKNLNKAKYILTMQVLNTVEFNKIRDELRKLPEVEEVSLMFIKRE